MKENPSIGIIGGGFVGAILKRWHPEAKMYDINGKYDSFLDAVENDVVYIAVNFKDNCASTESKEALEGYFDVMRKGTVVIVKSTFLPGTTDYFQEKYPDLFFVYNPEFLTEMTAWKDFSEPQFQILGLTHQSLPLVHDLFKLLPEAPIKSVISPLDAEVLKHSFNSYFALKVTWFNQLYDACGQLGADYETVKSLMVQHPWVGDSHSIIFHKGYRGYGGKCLSKDPKNLASVVEFPLITHMEKYNDRLLGK